MVAVAFKAPAITFLALVDSVSKGVNSRWPVRAFQPNNGDSELLVPYTKAYRYVCIPQLQPAASMTLCCACSSILPQQGQTAEVQGLSKGIRSADRQPHTFVRPTAAACTSN